MDGFWVHRGSNDLIYVVEKEPEWMVSKFGIFLNMAMVKDGRKVYAYNKSNPSATIFPDWSRLISIEVQTKKWKEAIRQGKSFQLHVKFYFDKEWAVQTLGKEFNEETYKENLKSIAKYWDEDCVSHVGQVFSDFETDKKFNTIVTDSIIDGLDFLYKFSLPENKNLYIVTEAYRKQLLEYK